MNSDITLKFSIVFVLLFLNLISSTPTETISSSRSNFGTIEAPNLTSIVTHCPQNCAPHLVTHHEIQPENLDLSNFYKPVILSSTRETFPALNYVEQYKKIKPYLVQTSKRSGTFCRFLIFHLGNRPDIMRRTDLLHLYTFHYMKNWNHQVTTVTSIQHVYVLVLLTEKDYKYFSNKKELLYRPNIRIIPNFAVLILSSLTQSANCTICVNKYDNSWPYLRNLQCVAFSVANNIATFYAQIKIPWDWEFQRDHVLYNARSQKSDFLDAVTKTVHLVLKGKLNLTFFDNYVAFRARITESSMTEYMGQSACTIILANSVEYNFLTCHTTKELSFRFYQKPFQLWVWVGILLSLASLIVVGEIFVKLNFKENLSFSIGIYFVGSVFESLTYIETKVKNANFFRVMVGAWLISVTTLTNCYKGLVIMGLNAPSDVKHPNVFEVFVSLVIKFLLIFVNL